MILIIVSLCALNLMPFSYRLAYLMTIWLSLKKWAAFAIFAMRHNIYFAAYSFPLNVLLLLQAMHKALLSCVSFCDGAASLRSATP